MAGELGRRFWGHMNQLTTACKWVKGLLMSYTGLKREMDRARGEVKGDEGEREGEKDEEGREVVEDTLAVPEVDEKGKEPAKEDDVAETEKESVPLELMRILTDALVQVSGGGGKAVVLVEEGKSWFLVEEGEKLWYLVEVGKSCSFKWRKGKAVRRRGSLGTFYGVLYRLATFDWM